MDKTGGKRKLSKSRKIKSNTKNKNGGTLTIKQIAHLQKITHNEAQRLEKLREKKQLEKDQLLYEKLVRLLRLQKGYEKGNFDFLFPNKWTHSTSDIKYENFEKFREISKLKREFPNGKLNDEIIGLSNTNNCKNTMTRQYTNGSPVNIESEECSKNFNKFKKKYEEKYKLKNDVLSQASTPVATPRKPNNNNNQANRTQNKPPNNKPTNSTNSTNPRPRILQEMNKIIEKGPRIRGFVNVNAESKRLLAKKP